MQQLKGFTFFSMLRNIIVLLFLGILILKIVPIYIQDYSIRSSIKALSATDPTQLSADSQADSAVLKAALMKQLELNSIEPAIQNKAAIEALSASRFKVSLKYQVVRPLFSNISLLFDFNDTQEIELGHAS